MRLYDGSLAFADQEIGALRRALEAEGLWERTVVIVAADHGEELYERGWIGHNVHVYEPSVHVPLIVRFPKGAGPAGLRIAGAQRTCSTSRRRSPTCSACCGKGGSEREFQGRSLLPVIAGAPGKPAVLSRTIWDRPRYALRDERFKYFYDTRSGEEQPVRPRRPTPARRATWPAASRCAPRTTARRSTLDARSSRAAAAARARGGDDVRAVREPEGARLHPGRLPGGLQVAESPPRAAACSSC